MDIPDEAIEFVDLLSEATDMCLGDCLGDLSEDMRAGSPKERSLRAAAVIESHARSAQVAVLRELEGRFVRISENWTLLGDPAKASVYGVEGSYLRGKLDELEAGAGQAGVRDE